MQKIDIMSLIEEKNPDVMKKFPGFLLGILKHAIESITRLRRINDLLAAHQEKRGGDFIDAFLDEIDCTYSVSMKGLKSIPSEGKLLIVANHPLGGLDGLLLYKCITSVRADVKIIVNDVLLAVDNLSDIFLPFNVFERVTKQQILQINQALQKEQAVIIFPSGEVSRWGLKGLRDTKWKSGIVYLAEQNSAPVLPVYVEARNSILFYAVSLLTKKLSTFLLPNELFNKKGMSVGFKIGSPIPAKSFNSMLYSKKQMAKLLKKHIYSIGKNKNGVFHTEKTVVHPGDRKMLYKEIKRAALIGKTADNKSIYLIESAQFPLIMKEIGRLREITFRKVGEGTGFKVDLDIYDTYYKHIVLWDEEELDIVGAYRVALGHEIMRSKGEKGFYTNTLFEFPDGMGEKIEAAAEFGRSFVQAKYWNSHALDYLWMGIGAFLVMHPEIRYLFGPVSISSAYDDDAKKALVYFYRTWFGAPGKAAARNAVFISTPEEELLKQKFPGLDYAHEFKTLKSYLRIKGYTVPTLYKQYSELCEPGGVMFYDFSIDHDFKDCVDGFIFVDIAMMKQSKRQRYLDRVPLKKFNIPA